MAGNERFTQGTVNEALSRGESLGQMLLRSAGFTPIGAPTAEQTRAPENYNGGLQGLRIGRLQAGDLLFRFSDSRHTTLPAKFAGDWWFDRECMATIRHASRLANGNFTRSARSHLGILYEWGNMGNLVGGLLTKDFWCFRGLTGGVAGKEQEMSGPLRTDVIQIFVPGGLSLAYFDQPRDDIVSRGLV